MILRNNIVTLFFLGVFIFAHSVSASANQSVVENVIAKGFPKRTEELSATTHQLFDEYERENNVLSLLFYAYGMLQLANHFEAVNDYVNASEHGKLGFFYLDEAADSHEDNALVRYLRARIDAYLPASLGRCVVTLKDTDLLLKQAGGFTPDILAHIQHMRYRALYNCKATAQADKLSAEMRQGSPMQRRLISQKVEDAPEWDLGEITQVLIPLIKGEKQ